MPARLQGVQALRQATLRISSYCTTVRGKWMSFKPAMQSHLNTQSIEKIGGHLRHACTPLLPWLLVYTCACAGMRGMRARASVSQRKSHTERLYYVMHRTRFYYTAAYTTRVCGA
jgi:hypothetical protein